MTPTELYRANISWINDPELPEPQVKITSKDLAVLALLEEKPTLLNLLDFQIDKRTTRVKAHLETMEERDLIHILPSSNLYSFNICREYSVGFRTNKKTAYSLGKVFGVDFQPIKDKAFAKSEAYLTKHGIL